MRNPLFIAIEGTDGAGKATQTALLAKKIIEVTGFHVATVTSPDYGKPYCYFVEQYKRGVYGPMLEVDMRKAALCFSMSRTEESTEVDRLLESGSIVLADRWMDSNYAHQGAKCVYDEVGFAFADVFLPWLRKIEIDALGIREPHKVIILDVPIEISAELMKNRPERDGHEVDLDYQRKVRMIYHWLAERDTEIYSVINCVDKDGNLLPSEVITEKIFWHVIEPLLQE